MNKIIIIGILLSILTGCTLTGPNTTNTGGTFTGGNNTGINQTGTTSTGVETGSTLTGSTGSRDIRTIFLARGNEPFWAFEQTATGAKFSRPGENEVEETLYTTVESKAGNQIFINATPLSSTGEVLNVNLTPGNCSDGMSDTIYNYQVLITTTNENLRGCANISD